MRSRLALGFVAVAAIQVVQIGCIEGRAFAVSRSAPPGPHLAAGNALECSGVRVHAIAAATDPAWSFVTLSSTDAPQIILRRTGGTIGKWTIHLIVADRVWLEDGGVLCQSRLPAARTSHQTAPGLVWLGHDDYLLERSRVDRVLEEFRAKKTSFQRVHVAGRVPAIELVVKPYTLLAAMGFEDRDRIETINGFELTTAAKALEAYARLRTADHLEVQLQRAGRELLISYTLE